ncbi:hypothetical protein BX666DRAFT_2114258 [Dichotomocladium elegans]|nr:hypothetical protein BX666DRAFT_2114258 [Dichotomocladium elegans]
MQSSSADTLPAPENPQRIVNAVAWVAVAAATLTVVMSDNGPRGGRCRFLKFYCRRIKKHKRIKFTALAIARQWRVSVKTIMNIAGGHCSKKWIGKNTHAGPECRVTKNLDPHSPLVCLVQKIQVTAREPFLVHTVG